MGHVYISYFFKDKAFSDDLVAALHQAGIQTWRDVDAILPGQDWAAANQRAIQAANAMLIVISKGVAFSEAYPKADYLRAEIIEARNRSFPVLALLIDDSALQTAPKLNIPWLDFRTVNEESIRKLVTALPPSVRENAPLQQEAPKSRGYVFISYAEEDTEFVMKLREFLKHHGYGYWDYQDSDRNYQTQLFLELEEIIHGAAATISVLSPDWKRSKWAAKEYLFSEEVGTPVFLLMAREMGPTLVTAGIAYIDFTRDEAQGFSKLDRELRRKGLVE